VFSGADQYQLAQLSWSTSRPCTTVGGRLRGPDSPRTTYTLSDDVTGTITQFDNRVWSASFAGVGLYPTTRQVRDGRVLYV